MKISLFPKNDGDAWWTRLDSNASSELQNVTPLSSLKMNSRQLGNEQRETIIDRSINILEAYYAHLPVKRAMYAIDPIQKLKLIKYKSKSFRSDYEFHSQIARVFLSLRDLHTRYILPLPFSNLVAVLPFRVEVYYFNGKAQFIVAGLAQGFSHPTFVAGVTISHWNGVPIKRALDISAETNGGANAAARMSRGLSALTTRPLAFSPRPDEDWVTVTYRTTSRQRLEYRLQWGVLNMVKNVPMPSHRDQRRAFAFAVDHESDIVRRSNFAMYAPNASAFARISGVGKKTRTDFSEVLQYREIASESTKYGYIRIFSFNVTDVEGFVAEFARILELLPPGGLIIDVRDNPGGVLEAGERLLQLFSDSQIEPARLQFRNSPAILDLCKNAKKFLRLTPYIDSVNRAIENGAMFSVALPLTSPADCNELGRRYTGDVVVITSARSYSTTDFFAAGFQDHGLGLVIGTDTTTGAGGGNVWTEELLTSALGSGSRPEPDTLCGASISFAVRRALRAGSRAGVELEDIGVVPDEYYRLTKNDVLCGNPDLIAFATKSLAKRPKK